MSADKKTTASVPVWIALLCIVILCCVLAYTSLSSGPGTAAGQQPPQPIPVTGISGVRVHRAPGGLPGRRPGNTCDATDHRDRCRDEPCHDPASGR